MRVIAIDWSGALIGEKKKIWFGHAESGVLNELESGLTRDETCSFLLKERERNPKMVVGMDFAFSFPAWFIRREGIGFVEQLWQRANEEGEAWISKCEPPFWGRKGCRRPNDFEQFRVTEQAAESVAGIRPKSVFQLNGAGAVGVGSIRGMKYLLKLRNAGFSIWPFHVANLPMVVEIYPRLLTGKIKKSEKAARERYLQQKVDRSQYAERSFQSMIDSEDAFDAGISALKMSQSVAELEILSQSVDPKKLLEGEISVPVSGKTSTLTF